MPITYINFHAGITPHTTQNLMTAISQKLVAGATEFYILLSTPGGDVASGVTVYNFLRALPVPVTMHNVGNVDSIGNAIFLAANTRRACAHSTFMFHGVGFDVTNVRLEEKNARELLHGILANQSRIADIIVERTNIDRRRSRQLFREARTKDANDALAVGIIHEIADAAIPAGSDIVSFVFNP
jgi:ATP-dependent protease ClpP protease subunit